MDLLDKLARIAERREEVSKELMNPEVASDVKKFTKLNKEYSDLAEVAEAYEAYRDLLSNIATNKELMEDDGDPEMREMAKMELDELLEEKEKLEQKAKQLLVPKDPADDKNAVVEIRAGTGGDEACLFAGDLFRMYQRFADQKGWKVELMSASEGATGGYKEVIFNLSGAGVFGQMKYESGVHRVQRVPDTESQGRVHTSAATVAVLPEAEEIDVEIKDSDIRKDTFCSSGPGGQSVNTTYSAIRLTHIPSGIVVSCQDEKSQIKNLAKAMKVLRARIYEIEYQKYMDEIASKRKTMVSSGDRSAKIRTYNFPQSRMTDHRINLTLYALNDIMNGEIQQVIDALQIAENAEKMKEGVV